MKSGTIIAFVVSLLLQVGVPLIVTIFYRRRTHAPWQVFAYGAIVYAAFQLFTWLPLSVYVDAILTERLTSELWAFVWLMASALSTALVEEVGRWWGYGYLFSRGGYSLSWRNGVMYGLGHGSLETVLLIAGLSFVYFAAYLVLSRLDLDLLFRSMGSAASPTLRAQVQAIVDTTWAQPLTVALERLMALPHQVAWALLVMHSRLQRQKRWFGFAVLYHFSVAVIVPGLARLSGFLAAEGANALLAACSVWIILKLRMASPEG